MPLSRIARLLGAVVALAPLTLPAVAQDKEELGRLTEEWLASPHGDYTSLSFTYWNKDGEVPVACAACHAQPGFVDYLGADGSQPGIVDHPAAINAPIGCAACHSPAAHALDSVTFPSGVVVDGLGPSAVCTVCHQGRQSGDSVLAATSDIEEDTVSPDLDFLNVHYGVAAAVMGGDELRGGFHYPGKSYAGRFAHVPGANTCVACHDAHTTQVATEGCLSCHRGVEAVRDIRTRHQDFDGDGDNAGGIHAEIVGLHGQLYAAIQAYGAEVAEVPIGYESGTYPYFFADTDNDGAIGPDEAVYPNRYQGWTPRLLKAAYNYQVVQKDPGGYVHNPTYLLQLLYDSLESLSQQIEVEMTGRQRP
ncbi:polyheme membrane-associated cytochrome C [Paracoccus salsus]|uniref:polyheme membrane-associated cytochrome C n=1 Tax=Paracoccus salsus TaxID=2911061 RepID=UPI001F354CF7|nr:polyheme membrane-associated cytochrome C [Paracoccus salsus]MCF3972130.1 polyheme membrane-associated cytochrome C [Paracoccus salsus]